MHRVSWGSRVAAASVERGPLSVAEFERFTNVSRCHVDGNVGVLVAAPFARSMHVDLRRQLFANLLSHECANAGFNIYFALCVPRCFVQQTTPL